MVLLLRLLSGCCSGRFSLVFASFLRFASWRALVRCEIGSFLLDWTQATAGGCFRSECIVRGQNSKALIIPSVVQCYTVAHISERSRETVLPREQKVQAEDATRRDLLTKVPLENVVVK